MAPKTPSPFIVTGFQGTGLRTNSFPRFKIKTSLGTTPSCNMNELNSGVIWAALIYLSPCRGRLAYPKEICKRVKRTRNGAIDYRPAVGSTSM